MFWMGLEYLINKTHLNDLYDYLTLTNTWSANHDGGITRITEPDPNVPHLNTYFGEDKDTSSGDFQRAKEELVIQTNQAGTCGKFSGYTRFMMPDIPIVGTGIYYLLKTDFKVPNWSSASRRFGIHQFFLPQLSATRYVYDRYWGSLSIGLDGTIYFEYYLSRLRTDNAVAYVHCILPPILYILKAPTGEIICR